MSNISKESDKELDPSEGFTCHLGDVGGPEEWDHFEESIPHPLEYFAENEIDPHGVTFEISKTPERGRRLRVNVSKRIGFTDAEMKRHQSACKIIEVVVNSAEFKKRVLAKKFTTTKKTSQQIYDHIITGEETLQKGVDYEMDVLAEMYYEKNNIVGYTYANVTKTWLNRYVTKDYDEGGIAGNLMHEWLHKLSYGHSSPSDHSSVPYAIGYMVRDMVREYQKGARWVDLYPNVVVTTPAPVPAKPATPTAPETPAIVIPPIKIPAPTPEPKRVCHRPFWPYFWTRKICYFE